LWADVVNAMEEAGGDLPGQLPAVEDMEMTRHAKAPWDRLARC